MDLTQLHNQNLFGNLNSINPIVHSQMDLRNTQSPMLSMVQRQEDEKFNRSLNDNKENVLKNIFDGGANKVFVPQRVVTRALIGARGGNR